MKEKFLFETNNEYIDLGGKANSLFILKENNIPVPDFFVLSDVLFQSYMYDNAISFRDSLECIREKILKGSFSENSIKEIFMKWDFLEMEYVSVRSSAIGEDSIKKSFAGQYETFLNVTKENLLEKIKECYASMFKDNVVAYQRKNLEEFRMNVIVQKMFCADYSGVAFSIDTTSKTKNYSVIECVTGLGEQLVSGKVIPSKYLVRRKTKRCDLFLGSDQKLDANHIFQLESLLLNIEKIYQRPVDIEWGMLNNNIMILQARPITSYGFIPVQYEKVISRDMSLIEAELYYMGEYKGIKKLTRGLYYFKPMFYLDSKKGVVDIYYNLNDLEEDPSSIFYYMDLDFEKTNSYYQKVLAACEYLNDTIDQQKEFNFSEYLDAIQLIYPFSSLGNLAGRYANISGRVKKLLIEFRNKYDYVLYKAKSYLIQILLLQIPDDYKKYIKVLSLKEIMNQKMPSIEQLKLRKKGFVYNKGKIIETSNFEMFLKKHNFRIKQENVGSFVKGTIVYPGIVEGRVFKGFQISDFDSLKKGDILVTSMTTPKFIKILPLVGAIVTDEGGSTCHASIIAREFKIPCIVGCKNATEILNHGDIVTVDAENGVVKLKK